MQRGAEVEPAEGFGMNVGQPDGRMLDEHLPAAIGAMLAVRKSHLVKARELVLAPGHTDRVLGPQGEPARYRARYAPARFAVAIALRLRLPRRFDPNRAAKT